MNMKEPTGHTGVVNPAFEAAEGLSNGSAAFHQESHYQAASHLSSFRMEVSQPMISEAVYPCIYGHLCVYCFTLRLFTT